MAIGLPLPRWPFKYFKPVNKRAIRLSIHKKAVRLSVRRAVSRKPLIINFWFNW